MERPVDLGILRSRLAVDELPPHVGGRRHPVDLHHVVFPLDPLGGVVPVLGLAVLMVVPVMAVLVLIAFVSTVLPVSLGRVACARAVMLLAMPVVPMLAVLLACFALVVMAVVLVALTTSSCDQVRRQELHAALGAAVGLVARDLRMHGAHVRRLFSRLGEQLHAALRAAAGFVADHFRVHRAGVNDWDAFGHAHVHLGDERECLVGRRCQERLDALALFGHVAVGAQVCELVGVGRLRLLVGDRDRGKAVGALRC